MSEAKRSNSTFFCSLQSPLCLQKNDSHVSEKSPTTLDIFSKAEVALQTSNKLTVYIDLMPQLFLQITVDT